MSKRSSKGGKDTYRTITVFRNKLHDKKPRNISKSGTIIEKTKTITIFNSKVKKQMNNKEDTKQKNYTRKDARKLYDKKINIEKIDLSSTLRTTNTPASTFVHLKPYLTLTLKVVVHYDSTLTRRLYPTRSKVQAQLHTTELLQEIKNIFASSALRVNIKFQLNDVKFLKSSNEVPFETNAIKYLQSYCKWQGRFKEKEHYYSILLTGLDIVHYDSSGKLSKKNSGKLIE